MGEKELKIQDATERANELSLLSHELLLTVSSFLRKCYLLAIPPEQFVDFWCAVCCKTTTVKNYKGNSTVKEYPSIIDRPELTKGKFLSHDVQEQIDKIPFSRLNSMDNAEFCALLREGLPAVPDEDLRRNLLDLADLAALFKMNIVLKNSGMDVDFFGMLRSRFPLLKSKTEERWETENSSALELRNRWGGHVNGRTFRAPKSNVCISESVWQASSGAWLNLAKSLRIPETEAEYQRIMAVREKAKKRMKCRLIPLSELAEKSGCYTAEQVKQILTEYYHYECTGDTIFCNEEEALGSLSDHARQEALQTELQNMQKELERIKAAAPGNAEALLLKYLRQNSGSVRTDLLVAYQGGSMDRRTLQQLAETHKIVLDASLLKRREGRTFVMDELRPALERCGRSLQSALVVEATAMYNLMKGYMEFQSSGKKLRTLVQTPANRAERERLQARCDELAGTKAAYLFARDELRLIPTGIPDPLLGEEMSLIEYLSTHPLDRFCVLTCGATGLVKRISRDQLPLVRVGRVRSAGDGSVCSIFSQFLPFESEEKEADSLKEVFEEIEESLPGEKTQPAAEPEEPAAPAEAETPEPAEPSPEPVPESEKTVQMLQADTAVRHASEPFSPDLPLKTMDETLLPLSREPRTGDVLRTEEGASVTLVSPLMEGGEEARGGEGAVYVASLPGEVAKIYFADHLTAGRRDKLTEMLRHDPGLEGLCWPTHLLYNDAGEFVGYTMLRAPESAMPFSKSVLKIGSPSQRGAYMSKWTRSDLVRAARGAAQLLAGLHRSNILMGDVNAGNFMVDLNDSSRVYAVDTDSFQLGGYPCPVGFEDFTHPGTAARLGVSGGLRFGTFLRTQEEEEYALAILLFEILFLGANPFVTKSEMTYIEAMRTRNFPYANTGDEWTVPDGDNWMIWKNLPRKITDAFTATFAEWKTTSAQNWAQLMDTYLYSIEHFNFSDELAPVKYHEFHPEDPVYVDVSCAYCHKEFNVHKKRYADLKRFGRPVLCRECTNFLNLHRERPYPELMKCTRCGVRFKATVGDAFYAEAGIEPALCPDCRNPETTCAGCGQKFRIPYDQLERLTARKAPVICKDCRGSETVTCQNCGKTYEEKTWKVRQNRRLGRELFCDECREQTDAVCDVCGKTYKSARWRILKNKNENWPGLCETCRRLESVTVPCDSCGDDVTVPLKVFRGRRHNNQQILCSTCYRNSFR